MRASDFRTGKRLLFFFVIPLLAALLLTTAGALPSRSGVARVFSVKQFSPEGLVSGPVQIRVAFSSAAASSADIGRDLSPEELPVEISPPLPGSGRWHDASTFVYQPQNGVITPATRYSVSMKESLSDMAGNRLNGKRGFELHSAPLAFRSARQVNFQVGPNSDDYVEYELLFSLPVAYSRLEGFLSVLDGRGRPVPFFPVRNVYSDRARVRVRAGDGSPIEIRVEKGMTSEIGPLGLEKTQSFKVKRDLSLAVLSARVKSDISGSYIELETSSPLDIAKAPDFIKTSWSGGGANDTMIETPWGNITRVQGSFKPRDRVKITLLKGLPSLSGYALSEQWERAFVVPDKTPDISFASSGRFVSPAGERLIIPFRSVNVEKVRVRASRVYDNNVPVVMTGGWPYYPGEFAETVSEKKYAIQGGANEVVERAIDLRRAAEGRKGLFLINLAGERGWASAAHVINITDIAGSVRLGPEGALVWAASISSGKPLKGVDAAIWSRSNQLLAGGKTNADGIWVFERGEPWRADLNPDFITLRLGDDTAVLRLDTNHWDRSGLDLSGRPYPGKGYQAFCYTPRGVFRPGERVPMQFLLRDETLSLKEPFPVRVKVFTPAGKEWKTYTPMLSPLGMGSILIQLSDAAPTGRWAAEVLIPGEKRSIGRAYFAVEDFTPPRISVKTALIEKEFAPGGNGALRVDARYLFGSPGDGLAYEAEIAFIPRKYTHPDWPDFTFADDRLKFQSESVSVGSGALSAEGRAEVPFTVGTLNPPSVLDVSLRAGVMEDGGRWVYSAVAAPYYPHPILLGIQAPSGVLTENDSLPFRIAAIDPSGKRADLKKIHLRLFKVSRRPQLSRTPEGTLAEDREELVLVEERDVALARGTASADVTAKSGGEYVLAAEDPGSKASASYRFYVYGSYWMAGEGPAMLQDRLDLVLDKEQYKTGDRATVRVNGPFDGTMLLTVETDRVVHSAVGAMKDGKAELSFKVTNDMSPNAWVTAQLVRPAVEEEAWTAHRASGAVPISMDCTPKRLNLSLAVPEKLKPMAKNDFSLRLTDASGKGIAGEVSLMIVDDGVLDLTRHATPDPFDFYTSRRALGMRAYSVYDQLIPLRLKAPKFLSPGGGDNAEMKQEAALSGGVYNPIRVDRFKIITLHKRVRTDAAGGADFSFVLPEFSGRARLMAVAASSGAFGSAEKRFTVAREVVAELSLPRVAAPGDSFTAHVQLFNRTEISQDVRWELATTGPLTAAEKTGHAVLAPGESGVAVMPVAMTASGGSGAASVKLTWRYAGRRTSQTIELSVRPPYPRISRTGSFVLESGKSRTLALPKDWLPGTRRAVVTASGLPAAQLSDLARFLIDYPYGCLEQTVSSGWALLAQPGLVQSLDPSLATEKQISSALADRLRRIQSLQFYNGAFASWPGISRENPGPAGDWNSIYATHFLMACKAARVAIPEETLRLAQDYLEGLIAMAPSSPHDEVLAGELALRAYACYVLSMGGDKPQFAWMSYLRDNLAEMLPSGRIILAAAYARSGMKEDARAMLSENTLSIENYRPSQREAMNLDSDLRTLALCMMAWNEIDPTSPGAAAAASNVLAALRATPRVTTQEASFALANLGNFFLFNKEKGSPRVLTSPDGLLSPVNGGSITRGDIPEKLETLKLTNKGDGRGFIFWSVDGVPLKAPPPEDTGLRVRVNFADSAGNALKPDVPLPRGAKVIGVITIESLGADARNVVVSMPLAGGLELENPRLMNFTAEEIAPQGGVRQEMRDDRLLIFIDRLSSPMIWKFTMRAVTPGRFTLPPVSAEGMYSPGLRSVTVQGRITVAPEKRSQ